MPVVTMPARKGQPIELTAAARLAIAAGRAASEQAVAA